MPNPNTRIKIGDSPKDMIIKMAEGNVGALTVCLKLFTESPKIDTLDWAGGCGLLLFLDDLGIYGSSIWVLYKNVCGENLEMMLALGRAWQLEFLSEDDLHKAIEIGQECKQFFSQDQLNELLAKVKAKLGDGWVSPTAANNDTTRTA